MTILIAAVAVFSFLAVAVLAHACPSSQMVTGLVTFAINQRY